jgi:hypothetical protein
LRWDRVLDLGWAGTAAYALWSDRLGCPVRCIYSLADWHEDVCRIRQSLGIGDGRLVDEDGVDWWALLTPLWYQRLLEFVLLQKLAQTIERPAEIRVTRPHPLADALGKLLQVRIDPFIPKAPATIAGRLRTSARALRTLTPAQVLQIAGDKWDTDYGVRRFLFRRVRGSGSVRRVLLPSAYRNVSRVVAAYASLLPERNFLLVTTRADGMTKGLPQNVDTAPLAAYAPLPRNEATESEIQSLTKRWCELREQLQRGGEPLLVYAAGLFADFDRNLRNGLRIRDAWRSVLEQERIDAVLCGDENNLYTRLPVLLARDQGVPTIYCSHGALDSNILIRGACSDTYLAKGEMERDYLVQQCHLPPEKIFVGAAPTAHLAVDEAAPRKGETPHIVFFSEPYELYSGRTATLYQELMPALCAVARSSGRRVVVKLHPFESLSARTQLVDRVLEASDRKLVEVTAEPMSEQLLRGAWFSLTVESSVAVECALAGVPAFLCGWFDIDLYDYGRQYEKFGAARFLTRPEEIASIPKMLEQQRSDDSIRQGLYRPIRPQEFETVLGGKTIAPASPALPVS